MSGEKDIPKFEQKLDAGPAKFEANLGAGPIETPSFMQGLTGMAAHQAMDNWITAGNEIARTGSAAQIQTRLSENSTVVSWLQNQIETGTKAKGAAATLDKA